MALNPEKNIPAASPHSDELGEGQSQHGLPAGSARHWTSLGICVFLAVITLAVFGQTLRHGFVNYDDDTYVYDNPHVAQGLSWKGIAWAFTHSVNSNWHPLTVISDMLDCQLYGLNAGGHHLTNVLLHAVAVVLLFLVLREMTGAQWRSAFVATVFAIHPLRVESVAWVAERKDVLSGVFFMLTLWAYARYARVTGDRCQGTRTNSVPSRFTHLVSLFYFLVLLFFALGLMSKPMLVTLPFVLLLLDYWPLNRFARPAPASGVAGDVQASGNLSIPRRLFLEKIPLLALSCAVCVTTLVAQRATMMSESLALRIGNAAASYAAYLSQMVFPADLAVLYPYPVKGLPFLEIALAFLLLAAISTGAFLARRQRPYLLAGWLWYLGMLVPVIGLVQVGWQARADRYTYLPQIGLYFALTWLVAEWSAGWRHRRWVLGSLAATVIAGLSFCAGRQVSYWKNSESLWTRTLAVTADNYIAETNLGEVLAKAGRLDEAMNHFQEALKIKPDHAPAQNNVGLVLLRRGRVDEAIVCLQTAIKFQPGYADAHNNLGIALRQRGRVNEAVAQYQKALEFRPEYVEAHNNLGNLLLQLGRLDEAMVQYRKALEIQPAYFMARNSLGFVLLQKGWANEAINCFREVLKIQPEFVQAQNNLAWVLATSPEASVRNGTEAVELAQRADRNCGGKNPIVAATLAAAYAETGQFPEALATARRAQQLARDQSNPGLVNALQVPIGLYQAGSPFRDPGQTKVPARPGSP